MGTVYKIVSKYNGKVYVGSTKNFENRKKTHFNFLKTGGHHNRKLQCHYNKYGHDDLEISILEEIDDNGSELLLLEQKYIDKYNSVVSGFNINPIAGNSLGSKHSAESRNKMSERSRGSRNPFYNKSHTTASKLKMSESGKGKKKTEEHKAKIGKSNKGKSLSEESKNKMSLAKIGNKHCVGRKFSQESIEKMSFSRMGNKNCVGRKISDETRDKMRQAHLKRNLLKNVELGK